MQELGKTEPFPEAEYYCVLLAHCKPENWELDLILNVKYYV